MNENPAALIPELTLVAGAVLGLLLGSWLPRRRQWWVRVVTACACLAGIVATGAAMAGEPQKVFGDSYAIDTATNAGRLIVLVAVLLVICLSSEEIGAHPRETEFHVLMQLGALGTIMLAGASDVLLLVAAYLLASIPLYALAGFAKDASGTEASLKYYLMGAFLGIALLGGTTILYGSGGATNYAALARNLPTAPPPVVGIALVAVLGGLLFKIGAVPAHFWVPDVTEGAATSVAAFVTTVPKIGGLIAAYRLLVDSIPAVSLNWPLLVAILAAASMTLGNLAAFFQDNVRRLLAYSTISQVGYILMAIAVAGKSALALPGTLFYLGAYAVTNLGAFAVVAAVPRTTRLEDYRGLGRAHPMLAGGLVVCLLGLVGTPPTSVFLGKLEVFTAAIDGDFVWLAVLAVLNTVASLFYYLRWILPVFSPASESTKVMVLKGRWAAATAYLAAAASLLLGMAGGAVLPLTAGPLVP